MIGFFLNILEITVGISLLVLIMLLVLKLFGGRFTAKCRYILWLLVLVRLAIPFSFNILPSIIEVPIQTDVIVNEEQNEVIDNPVEDQTPTTPPTEDHGGTTVIPDTTLTPGTTTPTNPGVTTTPTNPTIPANPSTPTVPDTPTDPVNPSVPSVDVDKPITNDPPQEEVIIPTPIPETPKEPLSVMDVLKIVSIVYIAGAVIFFLWNMLSYIIYTQRILRSARNADAKTIAIFLSICDKENLKKVPVLLVSPDINSPAAFGLFSRKIVLPDITFTQNGLAGTLFHEVVHCKRGDLYIKVIELVARSLHWFNPLAHVSAFRCEMEMEMSCDETVLTGCNDDARAAYGEVMLDIIRRCRRNRGALTTHFNPKKNSVKSRFANIINGSGSRRGKVLIPICLVLCILAGTIVACSLGGKNTPNETGETENKEPDIITVVSNEGEFNIVTAIGKYTNNGVQIFDYSDEYLVAYNYRNWNDGIAENFFERTLRLYSKDSGEILDVAELEDSTIRITSGEKREDGLYIFSNEDNTVKGAYRITVVDGKLNVAGPYSSISYLYDIVGRVESPNGEYVAFMELGDNGKATVKVRLPDGTVKAVSNNNLPAARTEIGAITDSGYLFYVQNQAAKHIIYDVNADESIELDGYYTCLGVYENSFVLMKRALRDEIRALLLCDTDGQMTTLASLVHAEGGFDLAEHRWIADAQYMNGYWIYTVAEGDFWNTAYFYSIDFSELRAEIKYPDYSVESESLDYRFEVNDDRIFAFIMPLKPGYQPEPLETHYADLNRDGIDDKIEITLIGRSDYAYIEEVQVTDGKTDEILQLIGASNLANDMCLTRSNEHYEIIIPNGNGKLYYDIDRDDLDAPLEEQYGMLRTDIKVDYSIKNGVLVGSVALEYAPGLYCGSMEIYYAWDDSAREFNVGNVFVDCVHNDYYGSIDEIIENCPEHYREFYDVQGEDIKKAVDMFLSPDEYREELGEYKYSAYSGIEIKNLRFYYNEHRNLIFLCFEANGGIFGTLNQGYNMCMIDRGSEGYFVDCGDVYSLITADTPVIVLSNPGGLKFKTIYIPYDRRYSTYDFDSEHILLMTYGTEQGERGHVTATTDICFYLVNTVRGELVATLEYGRAEGYLTSFHHEQDALILYDLNLDEETHTYSVHSALRIEYKNGQLSAQATEKDPWPRSEAMLVSPGGDYTVYEVTDDGHSHGGIDVLYPDGTTKRILTNVMLDDPGVYSVGGVTGYSPIQFIDNDRLLYHIGGWEWTKGYGIYNLTTGENTEFRNGYGAIGYADGYIYLREVSGYDPIAWYKASLDGNIQKIASVNEEENIFRLQDSRDIRFGGTSWRRTAGIYPSDYQNADGNAVVVKIYSLDINQQNNVLAEVRYDTTDCEILTISHGMTETAIVFAQEDVLSNVTKPASNPVTVISNPKGYSVQTVYIPVSESGRSSAYPYSDSQMLYMTFDLVTDAQGVTQAYSNIKLYLVDKERGRIVGECAIDGEYQLNNISYNTSGDGIVLRDVEFTHDRGYLVHGAFHILYSGGKLTATKVESAAYPQHDMPVIGNARDGVVYAYRTTDDGVGRGGIDLTMPDGTVKRILSNVVLDDAGGNLSNVMYYTPVGFIGATVDESAKLVYNIGAYEGAGKGFGIYDTATGEREEFLYMNYRAIDVWSNSIYFEEYKRTDEGYSESYRLWKRDRHGNMTLLWSLDPADGDAYHEGEPFPSFKNGLWYFDTYTDTEVPSYIKSNGYVTTEIRHGDDFDPIVSVMYPHTVDRYSSNLLVTTSGRATVVLRVPESVIPPSVVTVEFSTIEELIEKFGNQIDAFAPGTYARREFLDAVDKFINPVAHQDNMSKSEYSALSGMKLENISATYDSKSGKMYLTFTVTGEPVGSLKKGENTAEICENMYGIGVMCGDTSENNANEARSAVSKYLHWIGFNGMPDSTWSGSYNFTDYMASCLNDIGKTPTRDAIVDYAERCFGISGYSPLNNQFDESGNHVQLGYGLSVTNFIITGDKVEGDVHTVTVDIYRSSFYYDKYQTLNFYLTKLSDGAWKFIDITVAADGNEGVFKSILANQTPIYLATSKKEKFLSEFLDGTVYSLKKYTILDLDGDGRVEMVLWIARYTNDYAGFLVLHREGDVVYAHELPYRKMTGLKSDGTFSFSSGAADSGIGKIEFSGDTFSVIKLAYSESEMTKNIRYYIDDKPVSQESFDAYWDSHSLFKLDAEWIEYDGGGGTVTTFSTVDELVAAYGEAEILDRVLYGGAYSIDDLRFAVNSFLDPRKYREEIGETKYYARDGLGIKDPTLTYDRENGKIYLNFTAVGEPIGTLKLGKNTCAVQVGVNGVYVACGEWIAVDTEAKAALHRYLSCTGLYDLPDITKDYDKGGLTRYIIQSLTDTGIVPTLEAIQEYAKECFNLENYDPGDWPVVNGVYDIPGRGGLDFPYLIVDEVEEGVIHYVTAHFYSDYSYEVIEREVTFILYDLGVKKFRFEGATEWKIRGTNITVDVDDLASTMSAVESAEMYPADEYTVYVTGLSTPVTLFMRRDSVYKIEAFGHYLTTSEPHDMYGNCHHALFEVEGAIIFTWSYYSNGSNYIFTSKGCSQFDPAREDVSFLLYLDYMGNFKYRFTNKNEADIQQAVMYYVTTYNEFYYEVGDASIVDGTVVLGEITEYNTIGEVYSLDGMFAKGKEDGLYAEYETIHDLFEANKARREMKDAAQSFDPEKFATEIAKKSGSIITAHGTPIGGWIHYYFPAILSSAQRITVYYTTDFGLSTYTTTAPLPEGVEFDYGKVVAAGSGAGSGECMFILRLEKDDGVTFWSYMNFAGEEVNEFVLLGEITRENVHRYGRTWAELLSLTSSIPLGFEPSSYKTEIELITGKEVLFWHKIFSNSVYLYFVPIEQGAREFTVYAYKDYSMVINRNGEGLSELKLPLPGDKQFDTAEPVWAGGGGGSGECRFVVKLTRGSEVTYVYYNNFHYETDILDFRYAGVVPNEDLEYLIEEYPEIFGNGEPHKHSFKTPPYYTTFQSSSDGKVYHNKYKDCGECGRAVYIEVVFCGYQDLERCNGGCVNK